MATDDEPIDPEIQAEIDGLERRLRALMESDPAAADDAMRQLSALLDIFERPPA